MQVTMFSGVLMAVAFRFNVAWKEKIKTLPAGERRWGGDVGVTAWLVHVKHFGKLCEWFGAGLSVAPEVFEAAYPLRPASHTGPGRYWSAEEKAQVQVGPFGGGWWDRERSQSPLYHPGRPACQRPVLPPADVAPAQAEKAGAGAAERGLEADVPFWR